MHTPWSNTARDMISLSVDGRCWWEYFFSNQIDMDSRPTFLEDSEATTMSQEPNYEQEAPQHRLLGLAYAILLLQHAPAWLTAKVSKGILLAHLRTYCELAPLENHLGASWSASAPLAFMLSSSDCSLKSQSSEKKTKIPPANPWDPMEMPRIYTLLVGFLSRWEETKWVSEVQVCRCGGVRLCFVCLEPQRNWQHPEQPPKSTCKVPCQQHLGLKLCTHPQPPWTPQTAGAAPCQHQGWNCYHAGLLWEVRTLINIHSFRYP